MAIAHGRQRPGMPGSPLKTLLQCRLVPMAREEDLRHQRAPGSQIGASSFATPPILLRIAPNSAAGRVSGHAEGAARLATAPWFGAAIAAEPVHG